MLWSVVTLAAWCVGSVAAQSVVVTTPYGALQGTRTRTGSDSYVDAFYNIPYAKPPTGELRFRNPVVNEAWNGTRDATTPGPKCLQPPGHPTMVFTLTGDEDCLYLNVFKPEVSEGSGPLPVMVFIHGGGFYYGSAVGYNGTQLANKGVVVVTINYRLGAFGFLSTQDSTSVGNYGLRDQILALQWVRDVISSFNGDPQDVTIFGESAGSASVSLLILSRDASGLFTKAIMESGSSLSPWAVGSSSTLPRPREQALELISRLGCTAGQDIARGLQCVRGKPAQDIVTKAVEIQIQNRLTTFRPVTGSASDGTGTFPAVPQVLLSTGSFNNVTVLRGFNKDESSLWFSYIDPDLDGLTMEEFRNLTQDLVATGVVARYPALDADSILDLVMETYVTRPNVTDPRQLRAAYIQIRTDFRFEAPTIKEMQLYAGANGLTQYLYRFSYRSANRATHAWQGVSHTDELNYIFGYPLTSGQMEAIPTLVSGWTDDDIQMSQRMMTWWTNFAKYGNPTPGDSAWLPSTQSCPRYFDLNMDPAMVSTTDTPAIQLWNDVLPRLAEQAQSELIG